jgi:hypothetical protein
LRIIAGGYKVLISVSFVFELHGYFSEAKERLVDFKVNDFISGFNIYLN